MPALTMRRYIHNIILKIMAITFNKENLIFSTDGLLLYSTSRVFQEST